jgi:hypothetical protein
MLEYHTHSAPQVVRLHRQHTLAVQADVPASGFDQPVKAAQEGRLAGAGWPDDAFHGSLLDGEIDAPEHPPWTIGHFQPDHLETAVGQPFAG